MTHKKYDFFVDEDLKISSSGKTFDTVEWDKKAAPEDIFIWKSDDPNNADYGVVIGYKKNVDNYTILRFPSRCTKVTSKRAIYTSGVYDYTEDDAKTIRSYTKNILKVELPDTVKELGEEAFSGDCEYGSFNFSSLERIELSKNISKIEKIKVKLTNKSPVGSLLCSKAT
nr:MAG TPA: leucine rich repeat protein [Caudoviricetes sp.]